MLHRWERLPHPPPAVVLTDTLPGIAAATALGTPVLKALQAGARAPRPGDATARETRLRAHLGPASLAAGISSETPAEDLTSHEIEVLDMLLQQRHRRAPGDLRAHGQSPPRCCLRRARHGRLRGGGDDGHPPRAGDALDADGAGVPAQHRFGAVGTVFAWHRHAHRRWPGLGSSAFLDATAIAPSPDAGSTDGISRAGERGNKIRCVRSLQERDG